MTAWPQSPETPPPIEAETVAEIYIDETAVRVELEIGPADQEAFRNALSGENLAEDFVIRADLGAPIVPRVITREQRKRLRRDEITGDTFPATTQSVGEVLFLELEYPLGDLPGILTIRPPEGANIAMLAYHRSVPINDYQYLAGEETLTLDWDDPWFSAFRNPKLKRRYADPVSVFVYVEPFEVRKEIVLRARTLQQWADLGIGGETIPVEQQETIKQRAAEFLAQHGPMLIDGRAAEPVLDRAHFLHLTPRMASVIEPPRELDLNTAMLGVIFVYPTDGFPKEVTLDWDLFGGKVRNVVASASDPEGSKPTTLTPDNPQLVWENTLTHPEGMAMRTVPPPAPPGRFSPVWFAAFAAAGLLGALLLFRRTPLGAAGILLACCAAGLLVPSPLARPQPIPPGQAREIAGDLLYNIYRAFDHHDEGLVYDRLAQSVDGELLTEVYLQTRRGMEIENQGGAQAKVDEVTLQEALIESYTPKGGFVANCQWRAAGSVGHWGHIHRRLNAYEARLTIEPVGGAWKIVGIELHDETRLDPLTFEPAGDALP